MGLLDFDMSKITGNDSFMLGMNILGNSYNRGGQFGPAMSGGLQDYQRQKSLQAQQNRANTQAEMQRKQQEMQNQLRQQQEMRAQTQFQQNQAQNKANMAVTGGMSPGLYQHQNPNHKRPPTPSNINEWNAYSKMPQKDKEAYLQMKRASKTFDTGAQQGMYNQVTNQPMPLLTNQLKPSERPEYKQQVKGMEAQAGVEGKALGTARSELESQSAALPRLEQVANELSDLGKKATYTQAGQLLNAGKRELGLNPGEGAIARKEYISKVDNEVLPLLRQTFGAAFTEKEGASLKATLGDPNASPAEKDAVLRSFIKTKEEQIKTLERRTGAMSQERLPRSEADILKQYGL